MSEYLVVIEIKVFETSDDDKVVERLLAEAHEKTRDVISMMGTRASRAVQLKTLDVVRRS